METVRPWILRAVMMSAVALGRSAAAEEPATAVELRSAILVMVAPETPALTIDYQYAFPSRDVVHIDGFGEAPGRGTFRYVTRDKTLVIRDRAGGAILASVQLAPTVGLASRPPLNRIPDRSTFNSAYRAFRWTSAGSLTERSNAILARYFAYEPREVDGVTEVATTFTPLRTAGGRPAIGRLALLLSFPHPATGGGYSVRVRTIVQEGRPKSDDYRDATDPELVKAASHFVESVARDLGLTP